MGKRTNIGSRLHSVERGNVVAGANEILDDAKGKKQNVINYEVDAELLRLDQSKQNNLTFDNTPTEGSDNPVKSGGVYAADKALSDAIDAILILIPSAATALNQLADKNFVNSSIATDTATFRGTSAIGLSEVQFLEWANGLTHDMNDYVFWQTIDEAGNTLFKRYKWNGTQWLYEYTLNNSSFTADQWAAIMSGITSALVEKLNGLPTNAALQQALNSKQDALTFDNVPTENSNNPVKSGGVYSAVKTEEDARLNLAKTVSGIGGEVSQIEDVIPTGATSINKLVENASMEAYVASIIQNITSSFTLATADGHINLTLTQTNGQVATLTLTSSDIASAQDVANLQQLYNNLQQSKPVPVTALPETGQQQGVIYRLAGTTSYSDYMWNGSTWVLMATYNNAVDPRPKKASQNLVTSGGVFDNMGALDVSELNATENPHTPAIYVDLSAAIATIPTDYQKGGMSIKFIQGTVQSSDNKYVQFRCVADEFTTDTTQWAIVEEGVYVENPEFVYVKTDAEGKILWAIKTDGGIYYGAGCPQQVKDYIEEKIGVFSLDEYENIVAFLSDYLASDTTLKVMIDGINAAIEDKLDKDGLDPDALNSVHTVENPEFMDVEIDDEGKVLSGRKLDGTKFENMPVETPSYYEESIQDPENRSEIKTDLKNKIISYRDKDGMLHENAGIKTPKVVTDSLLLPKDSLEQVDERIGSYVTPKKWYLPKFGSVNIKSETFYLTTDTRWSSKNDVVCIQMLDDTAENAHVRKTLSYYYIKSTLTPLAGGGYDRTSVNENSVRLEFFPAKEVAESEGHYYVKKITKVGGNYYYTSTLVKTEVGGETVYELQYVYGAVVSTKVEYNDSNPDQTTLTNAIEVTQIVDAPQYKAWPVTKDLEHYCLADVNFGSFYTKNNVAAGIKYQGSGSTRYVKRGLRFTFYKNATYAKKEKVKIGEMVRLSGYNMKSYYQDNTRVNDPILSNLFIEMWETRGIDKCYPWNKDHMPFNGATGFIKSFPIQTSFGGEFFGLQFFGLKKDERNYMLDGDDDSSGIFAIGDVQQDFYQANHTYCADEMMDEMSQETADALDELFKYTTGFVDGTIEIDGHTVDFTNDMLEERIDIGSWIDYWIGCQVFVMWDSTFHNAVLYSGRDKKKFYLFFYDLDMSVSGATGDLIDIMAEHHSWIATPKFWIKFTEVYKDNILNRYAELRKSVLTIDNITNIYKSYISGIPEEISEAERVKWGGNIKNFEASISAINNRLTYLDDNYFCLDI